MNPLHPARVLLIDDHRIFNDGLKRLIDEQPDLSVCGQVFHAREVFFAVQEQKPQLVLLDINLQSTNGIDLGKKLIDMYPGIKVIVLTMYNQPKLLEEARKAGLHGYLLKDVTTPELLEGIKAVLAGKSCFDTAIDGSAQTLEIPFVDDFAQRLNLTFREVEIIRLVKEGLTNDQIANRLSVSFFTVKTHRKNIHFKLGLSNVVELIQFATKHGL